MLIWWETYRSVYATQPLSFSAVPPVLIQGGIGKASHVFKSGMLFLFNSYASPLDLGPTVEIFGWFCLLSDRKAETRRFPAGNPGAGEARQVRGDGVSQPTSSGSTTAREDTTEGQENSRKTHKKRHEWELGEQKYGLGAMMLKIRTSAITLA